MNTDGRESNPYRAPVSSAEAALPSETASQVESRIAGWLVLPALGLIIQPPLRIFYIAARITAQEDVSILEAEYPGYSMAFWGTTFCDALFVACMVYVAIMFFRRKSGTPRLMIGLIVANVSLAILECVWFTLIDVGFIVETIQPVFVTVMSAAIWIPYFLVSKRVKRTFVC